MANILVELDDDRAVSFYQDDNTGQLEIVPVHKNGGLIGEPLYVKDVAELVDLLVSCQNDDFAVFENQYVFEFEEHTNDN